MEPIFFTERPGALHGLKMNCLHPVFTYINFDHRKETQIKQNGWNARH